MDHKTFISRLRQFKDELPTLVGNEMVTYALDNLLAEKTVTGAPMAPRKANAPRNQGRRLLMDKGDGERSIRIERATEGFVDLTANEYMEAHNAGATISASYTVRAHTRTRNGKTYTVRSHARTVNFTLPARTFIAPSKELDARILKTLTNRFNKLTT